MKLLWLFCVNIAEREIEKEQIKILLISVHLSIFLPAEEDEMRSGVIRWPPLPVRLCMKKPAVPRLLESCSFFTAIKIVAGISFARRVKVL
jgi:hypothetical protein